MPYEPKNAPATFQRAMDVILAFVQLHLALTYLSDVIEISKLPADSIEQVRRALPLLYKAEVALNVKKCVFLLETLTTWTTISGQAVLNWKSTRRKLSKQWRTP